MAPRWRRHHQKGYTEIVRLPLAKGADVNLKGGEGRELEHCGASSAVMSRRSLFDCGWKREQM
jgi:hypothetical protein